MNETWVPVGELLSFVIGGGWGKEEHVDGHQQVAVIRGADFPQAQTGDASNLPLRYEETRKAMKRRLSRGDIVLEISGGTKDRPTGRTVRVTERLLSRAPSDLVIPASFCRLLRPDAGMVDPEYLYWWLQGMYTQGRTWGYQVQSTGLANFQMKQFMKSEVVRLPRLAVQRQIAGVLGALDDLIDTNQKLSLSLRSLIGARHRVVVAGATEYVRLGDVMDLKYGKSLPARARRPGPFPVVSSAGIVDSHDENLVSGPGIVVGRKGSVGTLTWVDRDFFPIDTAFYIESELPLLFLYHSLSTVGWSAMNTDSAVPGLNRQNALSRSIAIPNQVALEELSGWSQELWTAAAQLNDESVQLRRTRDELLPLLLSGRVLPGEVSGL